MVNPVTSFLPPIPPAAAFTGASGPAAVSDAVEDTLDLSRQSRAFFGGPSVITPDDFESFLQQLATLLRNGIVGTETRELDGRPVERFVTTAIGDPSLRGLAPYRGPVSGAGLDLRA